MQTSIYGLGGLPFRVFFWLGVLAGVVLQYWIPSVGETIATLFRVLVLALADLIR